MKTSLKKEHYGINSLINIQFVDTFAINNNDYMATFMIFQIHILDLHTLMRLFVSICMNIYFPLKTLYRVKMFVEYYLLYSTTI